MTQVQSLVRKTEILQVMRNSKKKKVEFQILVTLAVSRCSSPAETFFFSFWTVFIIFKWSLTLEFYLCWLTFMDYSDSSDRFSTNNILAGPPWAWGTFQNGSFTHLHIPLCFCFVLNWLCCTTCGILTLGPGIEPWPQQWQHWALTIGPPGKSPFLCFEGVIKSPT